MRLLAPVFLCLALSACDIPDYESPGEITAIPRPPMQGGPINENQQILFGDLHVHTTYSLDAFEKSMTFMGGNGSRPPADACDFARYCSQLDFWSINDHAEFLNPDRWQATKDSVRQCNAVAGEALNPDMVTFLGWEWTQIGATPETHFGHKNIVLRDLDDKQIPARPIASSRENLFNINMDQGEIAKERFARLYKDPKNFGEHWATIIQGLSTFSVDSCAPEIPTRDLPADCREIAPTPADLFSRLNQWQSEYLVIPHGNAWGLYTPPGANWIKQLSNNMHDPEHQTLIEVFSGHGNSEEYRSWRATEYDANGKAFCPEPSDGYIPCCWQAGEIVRQQCSDPTSGECHEQVKTAKQNFVAAGSSGHLTLAGMEEYDWKACGQCPDCFLPSFSLRPGNSAQAAVAQGNFESQEARHFRFGFIASSDNHSARPGTGYKEYARTKMTDVSGPTEEWANKISDHSPTSSSIFSQPPASITGANAHTIFETERRSSMLYTGGLVAIHSNGRDRNAIWDAMKQKQVYGTSGPRILLWFDLLNHSDGIKPMGSELSQRKNPVFSVKALGSFKQKPGCPDFVTDNISAARIDHLCADECYNPSDQRHAIERIEVIKITPQQRQEESLDNLIQDPWLTLDCNDTGDGCEVSFSDEHYEQQGRNAAYYVRAIEQATATINGNGLRCEYDEQGQCIEIDPCYGDYRTADSDDCLAPAQARAWSSPIYVDFKENK